MTRTMADLHEALCAKAERVLSEAMDLPTTYEDERGRARQDYKAWGIRLQAAALVRPAKQTHDVNVSLPLAELVQRIGAGDD